MMQKLTVLIFIILSFQLKAQTSKEKAYQLTLDIIRQYEDGNFDSIYAHFDSVTSRQISKEQFETTCESLPAQLGEFVSFNNISIDTLSGFMLSLTTMNFKNAKIAMSITFNSKLKIAGFYFRPKNSYTPPEYVNTLLFTEYKLKLGKAPFIISATLSVPNKTVNPPCLVIVGGSGPTDMDMSTGNNKPYKDIAWGLAAKGIAVLRFDKRTYLYGAQLMSDKFSGKQLTIKEEYLDDAKEVITYLKNCNMVNPKQIYILGHSQGGMLAPLICEQNKFVAGIIMMAANARSMQDMMIEQLNYLYNNSNTTPPQQVKIEAMKRHALLAKKPDLKPDFPEDSLPGATAAYWISINKYNQLKSAKIINQPMFFIQGERDYQVTMTDLNLWKENLSEKKNCTFKTYPKLNHHFMEGEGPSTSSEYDKVSNVPEYIPEDIANWIKGLPKN